MISIEEKVREKSSRVVPINCYDEAGAPVSPTSCTWTLTDLKGVVVNSRTNVALTPALTMNVVLVALDTALLSAADDGRRALTIKAAYTSGTYGAMTVNEEIRFTVEKLIGVT